MPDAEQQTKAVSQLTQDEDEYEEEVVHDDDDNDDDEEDDENGEAATCSALCSMGTSDPNAATAASACAAMKKENSQWEEFSTSNSCCPKQLQLPMFLSSTYPFVFLRILHCLKLPAQVQWIILLLFGCFDITGLIYFFVFYRNVSHD
jgi:hypothetical protein